MENSLSFDVHIGKKDLRKLYDFVTFIQSLVKAELMGMFFVLGLIVFFRLTGAARWIGAGIAALSVFFFLTRLVRRAAYLKNIPADAVFTFRTVWTRSGLSMVGEGGRKYYDWGDFREARETSDCFYLLLSEDTTVIIPKRDIPAGSESFCRELLAEKPGLRNLFGGRSGR